LSVVPPGLGWRCVRDHQQARFAPELLEELAAETANTVHVEGDDLIFDHLYIERRMTPLNLFLRTAVAPAAELAVLDYGQCIRDLAYTNIFAGDLGEELPAHDVSIH